MAQARRSTDRHRFRTVLEERKIFFEVMEQWRRGELVHGSTGEIVHREDVAKAIAARLAGITHEDKRRGMYRAWRSSAGQQA